MRGYHWAVDEGIEGYLMTEPMLFKEGVKINYKISPLTIIKYYAPGPSIEVRVILWSTGPQKNSLNLSKDLIINKKYTFSYSFESSG